MVVGTNVGIGLEASVRFAHLGAKFLLVTCRDEKKCDQTQKSEGYFYLLSDLNEDYHGSVIMQRTGLTKQPSGDACSLASWPLAFETFENVSAFVSRFSTEAPNEGQLNALVVNAGVFGPEYDKTPDGWEISCVPRHRVPANLYFCYQASSELPFDGIAQHSHAAVSDQVSKFGFPFTTHCSLQHFPPSRCQNPGGSREVDQCSAKYECREVLS